MTRHAGMRGGRQSSRINLSPLGFHGWADRNFQYYRDLAQGSHDSPASYLLLCRVIELELKAWHRQTVKEAVLTDTFGHDLVASYRALPAKLKILSTDEQELLAAASDIYVGAAFEKIGFARPRIPFHKEVSEKALEELVEKMMLCGDRMALTWR
jgi:hypothetical protein